MPAHVQRSPHGLLLTFERDGMVTDQQVSPYGFEAVSTALVMLAKLRELLPGDRLTVERSEGATAPAIAPDGEA